MRVYIRHAVGGRLFFDSEKHPNGVDLSRTEKGWRFTIESLEEPVARDLVQNRQELNIFVIDEEQQNQKSWYYSTDGLVAYEAERKKLTIDADSRMDYGV